MRRSLREEFRRQTTGTALPLIAVGIGINVVMGEITAVAKIPLYLDSVGTIFIGACCGMYAGAVCGLLSNITAGIIFNPAMMFFAPVAVVIGLFAGYAAEKGAFSSLPKAIAFGILQGLISAVVSAPIAAFVFGGLTFGGTDFIVLYFRSMGQSIMNSVLYQGLAADPVDKGVSYLLVFFVLRQLPSSLRSRLPKLSAR